MSRISQLLGCVALVSTVALAPAAMAKGGSGAAVAKPSPVSAVAAARGPREDPVPGPTSRVAPMMRPLEPHMFPGPALASSRRTAVVASPVSHAQLARPAPRADLASARPRASDAYQFPRATLARLHSAKLAGHSHERLGRLMYRPGSPPASE
jgi:hypothetical protein